MALAYKEQISSYEQPIKPTEKFSWRDGQHRVELPIDQYLREIIENIKINPVTIVQADTGVGKTTRIPQALLQELPGVDIVMTQTRRPAVRMNGARIATEMGCEPGEIVGWKLRGEDPKVSKETKLTLLIDQSLTNRIRKEGKLPDGVIIIDEAHERTLQIDVLLALIKQYLPNSPNTRVVITSATIDTEKFRAFFGANEPIKAANQRRFPVEVNPICIENPKDHCDGAINSAFSIINKFVDNSLTIPSPNLQSKERIVVKEGSVLLLLPGKEDIDYAFRCLMDLIERKKLSDWVEVCTCHGQMTSSEQSVVQQPVSPGKLRIVCATEIIRSSVTVPNTIGVIDSLEVKRKFVDKNGNTHLAKVPISGAESKQGEGRTGRQCPGFYIPISYYDRESQADEYETMVDTSNSEFWPKPAIVRESLPSITLQVASAGFDIRNLDLLDKPSDEKIEAAVKKLQKIGAIDNQGLITDLGKQLVEFPLNPERALVVLEAIKNGVLPEAAIAMAILENEGIQVPAKPDRNGNILVDHDLGIKYLQQTGYDETLLPYWVKKTEQGFEINLDDKKKRYQLSAIAWGEFAQGSNSDFYAAVVAYRAFKAQGSYLRENYRGKVTTKLLEIGLMEWCRLHFLNYKNLVMVDLGVNSLIDEINNSGKAKICLEDVVQTRNFDSESLTRSLIVGLPDSISRTIVSDSYTGPRADRITRSSMSAFTEPTEWAITESIRTVIIEKKELFSVRKVALYFSDMMAPIKPEWIVELLPNECNRVSNVNDAYFNLHKDKALIPEIIYFNGSNLMTREVDAPPEVASEKLAEAVVDDFILEGVKRRIESTKKHLDQLWLRSGGNLDRSQWRQDNILEWYKNRLQGICSQVQLGERLAKEGNDFLLISVRDFVDEEREKQITEASPEVVTINGRRCKVSYKYDEYYPEDGFRAVVELPMEESLRLAEPVTIPSGIPVFYTVPTTEGWSLIGESGDLNLIKKRVRDKYIEDLWGKYMYEHPGSFDKTLGNDGTSIDEISSLSAIQYGVDPVSKEAIMAYPVIFKNNYSNVTTYRVQYYRSQEQANRMRTAYGGYGPEEIILIQRAESRNQPTVSQNTEKTEMESKAGLLNQFLSEDGVEAREKCLKEERKSRLDRWNLAAAATALQGIEGVEMLIQQTITEQDMDSIIKFLQKRVISEAREESGVNMVQLTNRIKQVEMEFKIIRALLLADKNETAKLYLEKDKEAWKQFRAAYYQELKKRGRLPATEKDIDDDVSSIMEQLTS